MAIPLTPRASEPFAAATDEGKATTAAVPYAEAGYAAIYEFVEGLVPVITSGAAGENDFDGWIERIPVR